MFCRLCGSKQPDNVAYCSQCGAQLGETKSFENPAESFQYQGDRRRTDPNAVVHPYYAQEFENIAINNVSKFNMAAFFVGCYHTIYRGCNKRFAKLYLPYLLVGLCSMVYTSFETVNALQMSNVVGGDFGLTWLFSLLLFLWGLGINIYNGATFNRYYYNQQKGDPAVPKRTGGLVAFIVAYYVLSFVLMFIVFMISFNIQTDSYNPIPDAPYYSGEEQAEIGYGYDGKVANIIRDYRTDYPEQASYNGYVQQQDAWMDIEEQLSHSYMFYSDEITVQELFGTVDYTLENAEVDEEYQYIDIVFDLSVTQLRFNVVSTQDGYIWVYDAFAKRTDIEGSSEVILKEREICALLLYLYDQLPIEAEQTASLARSMRGMWEDQLGNTVELNEIYWNDIYYTLGTIYQREILIWVAPEDDIDEAEYYWMALSEDETQLTLEAYSPENELLRTEVYTRADS